MCVYICLCVYIIYIIYIYIYIHRGIFCVVLYYSRGILFLLCWIKPFFASLLSSLHQLSVVFSVFFQISPIISIIPYNLSNNYCCSCLFYTFLIFLITFFSFLKQFPFAFLLIIIIIFILISFLSPPSFSSYLPAPFLSLFFPWLLLLESCTLFSVAVACL